MAKFLFVSYDGLIGDIAWECVKEGEDVRFWIKDPEEQEIRQAGVKVVGGSPYSDKLEDDRGFGQQELKAAGVSIIPQQDFTSFDDAITFVKASPNRYVIKPSGEAQNYKRLLFVGEEEDCRDVVAVLEDYKRAWADKIKEFQLQRRIVGV